MVKTGKDLHGLRTDVLETLGQTGLHVRAMIVHQETWVEDGITECTR